MAHLSRWAAACCLALLVLASTASPAGAAVAPRSGDLEVFAGWYWPDADGGSGANDAPTFGIRGGYNFTHHFGMEWSAQGFQTEFENPSPLDDTDIEAILSDVTFEWLVNPDHRAVFQVFGGPGYSWVGFDPPVGKSDDDNVITAHFGVGAKISITDTFYMRPEARVRWFDSDEKSASGDDDGHTDWESTLGFGWYLGGTH